jgi:hypothetical protein
MTQGQLWRIWLCFQELSKELDAAEALTFYRDGSSVVVKDNGATLAVGDDGEDMMSQLNVIVQRKRVGIHE